MINSICAARGGNKGKNKKYASKVACNHATSQRDYAERINHIHHKTTCESFRSLCSYAWYMLYIVRVEVRSLVIQSRAPERASSRCAAVLSALEVQICTEIDLWP